MFNFKLVIVYKGPFISGAVYLITVVPRNYKSWTSKWNLRSLNWYSLNNHLRCSHIENPAAFIELNQHFFSDFIEYGPTNHDFWKCDGPRLKGCIITVLPLTSLYLLWKSLTLFFISEKLHAEHGFILHAWFVVILPHATFAETF